MGAGPIRFVKDIGLYAFSRGRATCKWRTRWCLRNCYNNKFYAVNPSLPDRDALDEAYWQKTSVDEFASAIKDLEVDRFRFSVRGEIWNNLRDVLKVQGIMKAAPDVLFWIPTRAWQDVGMMEHIEDLILPLDNARVLASMDPSVSGQMQEAIQDHGWAILFVGDNEPRGQLRLWHPVSGQPRFYGCESRTAKMFRCPKLWEGRRGHCAVCTRGCFAPREPFHRIAVHLKGHR